MDPNACLREFWEAIRAQDAETAKERHNALRAWLERGGFEPAWSEASPNNLSGSMARRAFFGARL